MIGPVTAEVIADVLCELKVAGRPVCVHASLRSFGPLAAGADTVIDGVLRTGATLLVPTSTFRTCLAPRPSGTGYRFNSEDDGAVPPPGTAPRGLWDPAATFVDPAMGALPAAVLRRPERVRGEHPLASFTALGPLAHDLVGRQRPLDVFAPLRALVERDGAVIGMGVGLDAVTLLHLAERQAGLRLLRRWAYTPEGVVECEHGGCSRGFEALAPAVAAAETRVVVGRSRWRVWDAAGLVRPATAAFRRDPAAGTCTVPGCARCRDIVAAAAAHHHYPPPTPPPISTPTPAEDTAP
jgi:aminoglycoside 3-N-acetyltransferase